MTDQELLSLPKVGPAEAASYLQNGTTAQEIRVQAQFGICPFCKTEKMNGRSIRESIYPWPKQGARTSRPNPLIAK